MDPVQPGQNLNPNWMQNIRAQHLAEQFSLASCDLTFAQANVKVNRLLSHCRLRKQEEFPLLRVPGSEQSAAISLLGFAGAMSVCQQSCRILVDQVLMAMQIDFLVGPAGSM